MSENTSTARDTIEALADSFVARYRAGQHPSIDEYARRYPELADELRELLPALVLLEQNAAPDDTSGFAAGVVVQTPREIGDFTIVREIGRGGMGVVYEAVQQSLGRHVALKVLSAPAMLNPNHLERFRLEARAAARLHHTHIVPVFGVGEHNGLHYYAMQFIQGQSLDLVIDALRQLRRKVGGEKTDAPGDDLTKVVVGGMLTGQFCTAPDGLAVPVGATTDVGREPADGSAESCAEGPQTTAARSSSELTCSHSGRVFYRSVARVGQQVADALAYAHGEGILHRDIKPSNLLLDAKGNVWITDFGLARDESSDGLTRTGDFVGTLRYMAPERLEGWSDRRSDLYSLGATLYELITSKPFLETPERGQLIDKILHENPPPPSKVDRSIPRDLETIILKAVAKEPTSRYRTAQEMAEDLERFLCDRSILARRSTPTEKLIRWCRRNPVLAGLTGTVAVLLLSALAILTVSNTRIRQEATAKDVALRRATAEAEKATAINNLLQDSLRSANPDAAKGSRFTVRMLLDEISRNLNDQLKDQPESRAAIHSTIGNAYRRLGVLDKAGPHLEAALDLRRTLFGNQHPDVAESLADYAWFLGEIGDSQGAEAAAREAVAIHRSLALPDELAAKVLESLALVLYVNRENYSELENIDREIRTIARKQPDAFPQVANVTHWMAANVTDPVKGEQLAREAVALHRKLQGENHPETAYGLMVLANKLSDQRRYDEAADCSHEALSIFRKQYRDTDTPVMQALVLLAQLSLTKGDQAAIAELKAVAAPLSAIERTDYESWMYEGHLHVLLEQWEPAKKCYFKASEAAVVRIPAVTYFAALLQLVQNDAQAYRQTCARFLKQATESDVEETWYWAVWTCLLKDDAVSDLNQVVTLSRRLKKSNPRNPDYLLTSGGALLRTKRFEDAGRQLTDSIEAFHDFESAKGTPIYAQLFLAMTCARLGRLDDAEQWCNQARDAIDELKDPDTRQLAATWNRAATLKLLLNEAEGLIRPVNSSPKLPKMVVNTKGDDDE